MANQTLFYRWARGRDAQSVDSWYLVRNNDGSHSVVHSWSHSEDADNPNVGTETFSVAQVLLDINDRAVLGAFRAAITNDTAGNISV